MVEREEIQIEKKQVSALLSTARLLRNDSGAWTLVVDLDGIVRVDEHREVRIEGEVRIRGRQKGRKPR